MGAVMLGQHRWAPPAPERFHTDPLSAALAGGASWAPEAYSTLGDSDPVPVPVADGSVAVSTGLTAQFKLTLEVPRVADGRDWLPGNDPDHPLARYGQKLSCAVNVQGGHGVNDVLQVATAHIQEWSLTDSGNTVVVEAFGPLHRVAEAGFAVPQAVRPGGTFASEMTRLMAGIAPLVIDDALTDRAAPAAMAWGDDRIEAIHELAEAWPARLRTDKYGVVWALPPLGPVPTPEVLLADGVGGTVVAAPPQDSRAGIPNRVVARGESQAEDRPAVQAYAQIEAGPMSVHGPYGVVTTTFNSPLLTSYNSCLVAARTRLNNLTAQARTLRVTCAPDPRISLDMAVQVEHDNRKDWGWVSGYEFPLVVRAGSPALARVDVEVPA